METQTSFIENPLLLMAGVREKLIAEGLVKRLYPHEPTIFLMVEGEAGQYGFRPPSVKMYYDQDADGNEQDTDQKLSDIASKVTGVVVQWSEGMKMFSTVEALSKWAFQPIRTAGR